MQSEFSRSANYTRALGAFLYYLPDLGVSRLRRGAADDCGGGGWLCLSSLRFHRKVLWHELPDPAHDVMLAQKGPGVPGRGDSEGDNGRQGREGLRSIPNLHAGHNIVCRLLRSWKAATTPGPTAGRAWPCWPEP